MSKRGARLLLIPALLALGVWKSSFLFTPVHAAPPVYTSVYDTVLPAHADAYGVFADDGLLRLLSSTAGWAAGLFASSNTVTFTPLPAIPNTLRIDVSSPVAFNRSAPETNVYFIGFRGAVYTWDLIQNTGEPSLGVGQAGAVIALAVGADGKLYGATPAELRLLDPATSGSLLNFGHGARALAVGPDGDIFALDAVGSQIERYSPDGTFDYAFPLTTPFDPDALVVGPDGRLYVADGVGGGAVYDASTGEVLATLESVGATADGPGRTSLTLDDDGYLYLYDAATGLHVFSTQARDITVPIQIKKGPEPTRLKVSEKGSIHVTIFSTPDFDVATDLDLDSLTFGRTGSEQSFEKCAKPKKAEKKGDKTSSIECSFHNALTDFEIGDTEAILTGKTTAALGGIDVIGRVPIIAVR